MIDFLQLTYVKWSLSAQALKNCGDPSTCDVSLPKVAADQAFMTRAFQLTFAIMGAVAVLYIIIGGFQYVSSQGNPQEVEKARNTIMYAVIGLVVAILAQAIVAFVLAVL